MQMAEQPLALSNRVTPEHLAELSTHTPEKHKNTLEKYYTKEEKFQCYCEARGCRVIVFILWPPS
jgi:hypothetical protein